MAFHVALAQKPEPFRQRYSGSEIPGQLSANLGRIGLKLIVLRVSVPAPPFGLATLLSSSENTGLRRTGRFGTDAGTPLLNRQVRLRGGRRPSRRGFGSTLPSEECEPTPNWTSQYPRLGHYPRRHNPQALGISREQNCECLGQIREFPPGSTKSFTSQLTGSSSTLSPIM